MGDEVLFVFVVVAGELIWRRMSCRCFLGTINLSIASFESTVYLLAMCLWPVPRLLVTFFLQFIYDLVMPSLTTNALPGLALLRSSSS